MDVTFFILLIFICSSVVHLLLVRTILKVDRQKNELIQADQSIRRPLLTILICARDEAENLAKNIPLICDQDYDNLQIVVVNHRSIDQTAAELERLKRKFPILEIVHCHVDDPNLPGKRSALVAGLLKAKGEYVLLTDADCRPAGLQWVDVMMSRALYENTDIVLGVGRYEKASSWLNRFIQFETFHTASLSIATAQMNWPYMGVGRNLLIKKELLASGIKKTFIQGVVSGDDDLLVSQLSFSHKMSVEFHQMAHTISVSPPDWATYFRQKSRHVSTAKYYREIHKIILSLLFGSLMMCLISFILLLLSENCALALFLLVARTLLVGWHHAKNQRLLAMRQSLWPMLAMEFLLIFVPGFSILKNLINKSNDWG